MGAKIAFYKGYGNNISQTIAAISINLWTWGKYSHVELIDDNDSDNPYDWDWYSSSERDGGVRKKTIKIKSNHWDIFDIHPNYLFDFDRGINFFKSQLGKDYDWKGIWLSQFLPLNQHEKNKWFCSEIVHYALCESCLFKCDGEYNNSNEFSPNSLFRFMQKHDFLIPSS